MKKRAIWKIGLILICLMSLLWTAGLESTTKQGIDYKVHEFKIPLYLKSLDFVDRHLNYRWTVQKIIDGNMSDEQKTDAIFQWTVRHIARQPKELPVIDDHVWHIIVRGYGASDQMADVCATLCNYAGLRAFILNLEGPEGTVPDTISLGAVYINGAWHLCDPWRKIKFVNRDGHWASIKEIASGNWQEKGNGMPGRKDFPGYKEYFPSLHAIDFEDCYKGSSSSIQSPVKRLIKMFRSKGRTTQGADESKNN